MNQSRIMHGDCLEVLATLPAESIDACVTDPPYGLEFMGKEWDSFGSRGSNWPSGIQHKVPDNTPRFTRMPTQARVAFQEFSLAWAQALFRVLKPGGHVIAFGGTRMYHRMGCAIEDAGFEIRDCLAWLYGSGFPKSLNLGEGLGTALKPAYEPIVLARKPLKGTVAANVERFGTGALNIDACRIGDDERTYDLKGGENLNRLSRPDGHDGEDARGCGAYGVGARQVSIGTATVNGRWPANVALDEIAALVLDEQSGELHSQDPDTRAHGGKAKFGVDGWRTERGADGWYSDVGGASRFYYVAKPSREERDYGCHALRHHGAGEMTNRTDGSAGLNNPRAGAGRTGGGRNFHPTVKPVELMRWLVKLVVPVGGTCLDPFMGSGTTGMACRYEQRGFIGIEREADYLAIADARIAAVSPLFAVESAPASDAVDPQAGIRESGPRATDLFSDPAVGS